MNQTIRLVIDHGYLSFPHGGMFSHDGVTLWDDPHTPSLLIYRYPAGDVDTFAWPLVSDESSSYRSKLARLASALYDERECNPCFPADALIELPDGTPFDFDQYLCDVENKRRELWDFHFHDAIACGLSEREASAHAGNKLDAFRI